MGSPNINPNKEIPSSPLYCAGDLCDGVWLLSILNLKITLRNYISLNAYLNAPDYESVWNMRL